MSDDSDNISENNNTNSIMNSRRSLFELQNKTMEDEMRDRLYRLKLQAINERLRYQNPVHISNDPSIEKLNGEIEKSKKKYEKLKEKIKYQKLENKISSASSVHNQPPQTNDRFGQYIEMMMLQQTQTQNMILNHMMLNNMPINRPLQIPTTQYEQTFMPNHNFNPNLQTFNLPTSKKEKPIAKPPMFNETKTSFFDYPGNESQIYMRQLGLAALFCAILKTNYEDRNFRLSDSFLFELKIKEIITGIQSYYLNQDGEIFELFQTILSTNTNDFRLLITRSGTNKEINLLTNELEYFLQNLISKIVEIIPTTGILSSQSRSLIYEFLQTEQTYPDKYFFIEELKLIQIDSNNTIHGVGFIESQVLLIGIFILRALVNTVMLKPTLYGLVDNLTTVGKENLRITSTILVYIYRQLLSDYTVQRYPKNSDKNVYIMNEFTELRAELLTDSEIDQLIKSIKKTVDFCKTALAKWASNYVAQVKPV